MDVYENAKSIVLRLAEAGYIAYFAGGWVRDFVMGHPSADIDIATSAPPEKIIELFAITIPVGLAFGIVIVVQDGHQFEVATFRKDLQYKDGRHPLGIELSNPQEDALRRDFTINGMFYDPLQDIIHDYVQGQADIERGVIKTIGDPHERFFEDRLRMLRAFRFSSRFGFYIETETQLAIREHLDKFFPAVAYERVWQEFNKMAKYPRFDQAVVEMHRLGLLDIIFPEMSGMPIKELRHLVDRYAHFPKDAPTILYLIELFHTQDLSSKLEIGRRLKASNKDLKLIEYFDKLEKAVKQEKVIDDWQWAHLMAQNDYSLCLKIISLRHLDKAKFLENCEKKQRKVGPHIQRIQTNKPLVTSRELKELGILPGKQMGDLIKEAEKISINKDIHDVERLLKLLTTLPLWNSN